MFPSIDSVPVRRLALALGAWVLFASSCDSSRAPAPEPASFVFKGGGVYTVDENRPWAEAVAVQGKEIVYVGDSAGAEAFVGEGTEVINLAGKMLLPGFVDGHIHPVVGMSLAGGIDLQFDSAEETLAAVASWLEAHPGDSLVQGFGWRYPAFPATGPHKGSLDALAPDRPVWLAAIDCHSAWVNSKALEMAGITKDTPDPLPGFSYFQRDPDGEATGYLVEVPAMLAVLGAIEPVTRESIAAAAETFLPRFSAAGMTAVFDAGILGLDERDGFAIYQDLEARGKLPVRVVGTAYYSDPEEDPLTRIEALRGAVNSELVQARVLKINIDGGDAQWTAAMLSPYADRPETTGEWLIPEDRVVEIVVAADAAGIDTYSHAFGDAAVRAHLDGIEAARSTNPPRDRRHTVSHTMYVDPADVPRFAELGAVAQFSIQWAQPDPTNLGLGVERLGMDVVSSRFMLARSIVDAGGRIAFGTDWPAAGYYSTYKPLEAIQVAVTREMLSGSGSRPVMPPEDERLTLEQSLRAATLDPAYLMGLDDRIGSIEVGKLADLVVLERNLFDLAPMKIQETKVVLTVMNGSVTHRDGI